MVAAPDELNNPVNLDKTLGQRLRDTRITRGLSQAELGEKIGATFQQIQKYERGINRMPASKLWSLAKALGLSSSADFFTEQPPASPSATRIDDLLKTPGAKALLYAYSRIEESHQRRLVVNLAEGLAPRWRWHDKPTE